MRVRLSLIADLWDKGFSRAQYTPPDSLGLNTGLPGTAYDREAVERFFAALPGQAPAGLVALPDIRAEQIPGHRWLTAAGRKYVREIEAQSRRVDLLPGMRLRAESRLGHNRGIEITYSTGGVLLTRRRDVITLATGKELRLDQDGHGRQVTDPASGEPVLWARGSHYNRDPGGYLLFPGRRCLVFPVTGTMRGNFVMTAVTESSSTALWFRWIGPAWCEVVVSPDCDLTAETLCAIDRAAIWLASYFERPGG